MAKQFRRVVSALLAVWLGAAPSVSLAAGVIDDGVRPVCDEAYYATTDYYGNLTDGSVVKSYLLNGARSLTDYGAYDSVSNLTDESAPAWDNGQVTFQFGTDSPARFYFEGKTAAPFRDLPWALSVHYALNGVPTRAEDLAGKSGVVEIRIDAIPNESADEYARNNYILAATAIFNQDDILSLEAPGAQLQLIGNLRTALFMAFPGEEQHFSIRVGTENFSFNGMTFLMMPATLSQLDEVSKLSEKKEDLEDSYHKLSDSLDTVLDSFSDMKNDLYGTADGLDTLERARETISDGKGGVYGDMDTLREDLSVLAGALDPLAREARDAGSFVTDSKTAANTMLDTTLKLSGNLSELEGVLRELDSGVTALADGLSQVENGLTDTTGGLSDVEAGIADTTAGLANLEPDLREMADRLLEVETGLADTSDGLRDVELGLSDTEDGLKDVEGSLSELESGLSDVENGLSDTGDGLKDVEGRLSATENGLSDLEDHLDTLDSSLKRVENGISDMESGLKTLEEESGRVNRLLESSARLGTSINTLRPVLASVMGDTLREVNTAASAAANSSASGQLARVVEIGGVYQAAQLSGGDPAAFFTAVLVGRNYDPDSAAAMAPAIAAAFASGDPEQIQAVDPAGQLQTAYQMFRLYQSLDNPTFRQFCAALLQQTGSGAEEAGQTAAQMERLWDVYDSGRGERAALELILSSMDSVSERIGGVTDGVNTAAGSLAAPTDAVLRDTSAFFSRLGELNAMVSDVLKLSETLRDTSGALRTTSSDLRAAMESVTDTSANLRGMLSDLRETSRSLRETLGAITDTSAALRDSLEALKGTSGSLRDTMGSLRDTSRSLRDTLAAVMDTSETLRGSLNDFVILSGSLRNTLDALTGTSGSLRESLDAVTDTSASVRGLLETAKDGSARLRDTSGTVRAVLNDADHLRDVLNSYEPLLQETLRTLETLGNTAAGTVRDSNRLLSNTESLMKSAGEQLDSGTRQTLAGLSSTLRKAAGSLDATGDLRDAKNSITDLIEDTWDEYTGDTNHLLLMDSTAETRSLTSARNPSPQSVQILIRTQEIEEPEEDETPAAEPDSGAAESAEPQTVLGRIGKMFRDLWRAVTGIFR